MVFEHQSDTYLITYISNILATFLERLLVSFFEELRNYFAITSQLLRNMERHIRTHWLKLNK